MDTETRLQEETKKWREKLDAKIDRMEVADEKGSELLQNARAYREDADHFAESGDRVRAFEAIVWAWAYIDIGVKLDHLQAPETS